MILEPELLAPSQGSRHPTTMVVQWDWESSVPCYVHQQMGGVHRSVTFEGSAPTREKRMLTSESNFVAVLACRFACCFTCSDRDRLRSGFVWADRRRTWLRVGVQGFWRQHPSVWRILWYLVTLKPPPTFDTFGLAGKRKETKISKYVPPPFADGQRQSHQLFPVTIISVIPRILPAMSRMACCFRTFQPSLFSAIKVRGEGASWVGVNPKWGGFCCIDSQARLPAELAGLLCTPVSLHGVLGPSTDRATAVAAGAWPFRHYSLRVSRQSKRVGTVIRRANFPN